MSIDEKIDAHKEKELIDKSTISKPELLTTPPSGRTLIQYPLTSFASTRESSYLDLTLDSTGCS